VKKNIVIAVLAGIIGIYFLAQIAGRYIPSNYDIESIQHAPNKVFKVIELNSLTEGGHAPYGQYLVLAYSGTTVSSPYDGYVIYAGYCAKLSYSWKRDDLIEISCSSDKIENIRTVTNKAQGINVKFEFTKQPFVKKAPTSVR